MFSYALRAPQWALVVAVSLCVVVVPARAAEAPASPTSASVRPLPIGAPVVVLTDTLALDPHVRAGVLLNGLHYYIRANHKPEKRAALRLAVNAGSTVEKDDQRGLAHFNEHMNFNGSEHFKPEELIAYLQSIGLRFGADANAYTSFDETVYMLEVPTDRDSLMLRGLTVLFDWAGRATLSDKEIDKERGVVLEEWRLGRGAGERMARKQYPSIFFGSRYADRLPIGLPEVIQKASYERLRAYYHDWYTPDRMAVIAVGDFDVARMEAKIREQFGKLHRPEGSLPTPVYDIPPHAGTLVSIATDREATGSDVEVMWKRPAEPLVTGADYRLSLLTRLYGSMLNARFGEIAHRADPPFLGASCYTSDLGQTRESWNLSASVKDGGIETGLMGLLEEAARVRDHGFLPIEFERARDRIRAGYERGYAERDKTENDSFALEYVSYFLNHESAPGIEAEFALMQSLMQGITLDEVNALTPRLMPEASRVILASAPEKAGSTVPNEAALRAVLDRGAALRPAAWVDETAGKVLMARLPTPGHVSAKRSVAELGATVLTLSNGVDVWLKPTKFKADEIVFAASAPGGFSLLDSTASATAWVASAAINDLGLGGYTSTELQKLLAGKIARAGVSIDAYSQGVNGSARPVDFVTALQLAHLAMTQPTRDEAGFTALKARLHSFLEDRANSPEQVFADTVTAVNTGRFYMNRVPRVAEVDAVTLDDVLAFRRARFANAADFTFTFAGNFEVDSIAPLLARYIGSLPSKGKRTSAFAARGPYYPAGVRTVRVRKGSEPKSSTRVTFFTTGQPIEELDMYRARVAASILTDHLRQTLRELMGGTYSASAGFGTLAPLPGYATMSVRFGCDPVRVDTMIAVAMNEVKSLRENGPSASDLQKQQEIERRELEVGLQQNGYWTGSILSNLQFGIDPRRIAHRRERIESLTIGSLHETYRKYFPLDRRTVLTLLPETTTGASTAP